VAYNTDIEQVGSVTFSIISDFLTSQPAQSPAAATHDRSHKKLFESCLIYIESGLIYIYKSGLKLKSYYTLVLWFNIVVMCARGGAKFTPQGFTAQGEVKVA